jgi:hypothetical protein
LLELLCPQANKNVSITAVKNVGSNLLLITIVVVLCRPLNLPLTVRLAEGGHLKTCAFSQVIK